MSHCLDQLLMEAFNEQKKVSALKDIFAEVNASRRRSKLKAHVANTLMYASDPAIANEVIAITGQDTVNKSIAMMPKDILVPLVLYAPDSGCYYADVALSDTLPRARYVGKDGTLKGHGKLLQANQFAYLPETANEIEEAIIAKLQATTTPTTNTPTTKETPMSNVYTTSAWLDTVYCIAYERDEWLRGEGYGDIIGPSNNDSVHKAKDLLVHFLTTNTPNDALFKDNAEQIDSAINQIDLNLWESLPNNKLSERDFDPELHNTLISHLMDNAPTSGANPQPTIFRMPDDAMTQAINSLLASSGIPHTLQDIRHDLVHAVGRWQELESAPPAVSAINVQVGGDTKMSSSTAELPDGEFKVEPVSKRFDIPSHVSAFDFSVPTFTWESPHPHVPEINPDYIFDPSNLLRVLYSLVCNTRCWLHGHTGTGKSTMIEQVCARLGYPLRRVNFDSEITRLDLIGRDVLTQENGTTVSRFEDGILPQAMQEPCVLLCDEMDFVRPDVAYVAQRVLEADGGLMLTEDAGRVVNPHALFRIFATANTKGQGDEFGMYSGARVQSMAFLERFTSWIKVDYMPSEDRAKLMRAKVGGGLTDTVFNTINQYVTEHIEAFTGSQVMQPISPRGYLELASATSFLRGSYQSEEQALREAFGMVILDRATEQDKVVLEGIAQRVFGNS